MFLYALDDAVLVQEMHLVFCGVNVHVDILWSDFQAVDDQRAAVNINNQLCSAFVEDGEGSGQVLPEVQKRMCVLGQVRSVNGLDRFLQSARLHQTI